MSSYLFLVLSIINTSILLVVKVTSHGLSAIDIVRVKLEGEGSIQEQIIVCAFAVFRRRSCVYFSSQSGGVSSGAKITIIIAIRVLFFFS